MATRSQYDELHDKYDAIATSKAGTRYERLTVLVFKELEQKNVVIHDMSLRGDADVAHQIDVEIVVGGKNRHVLVECKDFDISGDKVGLDIIRNFWAVFDDTKADEAIVVTCNGFSRDALKFAKAKGIKLAILRKFTDDDWSGRIKTIALNIVALYPENPQVGISVRSEDEKKNLLRIMGSLIDSRGVRLSDPVFFVKNNERIQFNTFLSSKMREAIPSENAPDSLRIQVKSDGWQIEANDCPALSFDYIDLSFDIHKEKSESMIYSKRVAELILSGVGDDDIIIFGDQIERHLIDPNSGEVLSR